MKNRTSILVMIFLFFSIFMFFSIFLMTAFAQTERGSFSIFNRESRDVDILKKEEEIKKFESLSGKEKANFFQELGDAEKINVFNFLPDAEKQEVFEGLSDNDKIWIFENLNDLDKRNLFRSLSHEDQVWIFEDLSDADKQKIFNSIGVVEKKKIFEDLRDADKRRVFKNLSDPDKQKVFRDLKEIDKIRIFRTLRDADKEKIFNTLSGPEREKWLRRFPELELIITAEEISPISPKKGLKALEGISTLSEVEKILSGEFPTDISRELRQFGYDFFEKDISTFAPVTSLPVGPDYIFGPGDSFTIHLWGKAEETYNVTVEREGRITLPRLGAMNVSGLTLAELKRFLFHKFREYYPDFEMSITMGQLRTIDIFVIGEAKNPGSYVVSSLSTIITSLFASGGPSKDGSLRNIKLFRNGELISSLDLYEFFIKGIKVNDIRLQPGDTVFIPVIGPVVGIAGLVKRPAIYEMKGTQTIGDAIELAGGVLPIGNLQDVVIERVKGHQRRIIKSFDLDPGHPMTNENLKIPLYDFDLIKVHPVHERLREVIYLEGHVKYPREYELKPGMKLRDIISSYDDLLPEPYLPQAEIIRLMPPDLHPEIIEFNLGALLSGDEDQNLLLQDQDLIRIYDKWKKRKIPQVTIKGAVDSPGTYRLYQGMTIKDLIFQAGNLTSRAYRVKASLSRVLPGETGTKTIKLNFSPQKAMAGVPQDNSLLQGDDLVHIREIPNYRHALERKVFLEGEFLFPGEYAFSEGERLSSVIERAGGLTKSAYPFGAVFQRDSVKGVQRERLKEYIDKLEQDILTLGSLRATTAISPSQVAISQAAIPATRELLEKMKEAEPTGRMVINLPEVLEKPSSQYNFELRPGDRLVVNKRPDTVNVMGEVYNPTALFAEKGRSVNYYLSKVGGMTENAEEDQIYIVKANGSVISKTQERFFGFVSWDSEKRRWTMGGFDAMKLDPGDTILVPRMVERYPWLSLAKDIVQIVFQLATTAGVIIAVAL